MSNTGIPQSSSAEQSADTAAAASQPIQPQAAAAKTSKREQKACIECGKMFGRAVYVTGPQSHANFERRLYCTRTCSAIVRERTKAEARK